MTRLNEHPISCQKHFIGKGLIFQTSSYQGLAFFIFKSEFLFPLSKNPLKLKFAGSTTYSNPWQCLQCAMPRALVKERFISQRGCCNNTITYQPSSC